MFRWKRGGGRQWPRWLVMLVLLLGPGAGTGFDALAESGSSRKVFAKENLVAWCVVPFDAAKRSPEERAEMLHRLGFRRFAYDWRNEHVPTFGREVAALRENEVELFAFWNAHEDMFRLFEKQAMKPQVWKAIPKVDGDTPKEMVEAAAAALLPLVRRTEEMGCRLGIYNHGGWGGEPENMVAVCEYLRQKVGAEHVGIVYNFHHGHSHIKDFPEVMVLLKPYLLCLNLNGMTESGDPMILPLGKGQHEKEMMKVILESGYDGPVGILDHRNEVDAEQSLRENLEGLKQLLEELGQFEMAKTYGQ